MGMWTHAVCEFCWICLYGEKQPFRVRYSPDETCCFCQQPTKKSGIYIRYDPKESPCKGQGAVHEEEAVDSDSA